MADDQTLAPDAVQSQLTPSEALARRLDAELRDAHPRRIIQAALDAYGDQLALVSSFGAESAVLLHLAAEVSRDIPVLFLDTGMQFGQTLDYRKQLTARLGLTDVRDLRPTFEDLATVDPKSDLYKTDTDACCHIRKVLPLERALKPFDAWITGRKRYQSSTRAALPLVEVGDGRIKINPLANWMAADVQEAFKRFRLPPHPLFDEGYASIGCAPCTRRVEAGEDARAGRWAGFDKTECGIHTADYQI